MTLKITVTTAGRAALINAANTGTLPVTVDKIGVTSTAFVPNAALTALPNQLKQLTTFGGDAVAADTIHTVIRDDSADTYSLFGFGLILTDGTLFGVYGQATAILEKSSLATMLLATDIIFADIDAASITFGDTNFLNPPATTDVQGVVELATDAETITGTDAIRAVTPKSVKAVLDDRLGAAAPTTFVKTLLNKATVLAFVTALGIRGAASFDTGTGNGLDADLLDGQHGAYYLDWANFANKPATFTPSAHNHSAAEITSGTLAVARGGTGASTFTAGSYLLGNGAGAFTVKTPAQVLADIGAAAVVHSHAIGDVNGLQTALDARPIQTSVTSQINAAVSALVNGSPGALDTLKELADAMGDDANFAATMANALALKAPLLNPQFTSGASIDGNPLQTVPQADLRYPLRSDPTLYSDANALPGYFYGGRLNTASVHSATGSYENILNLSDGVWGFQISHGFYSQDIYTRTVNNGVWQEWRKLAFTDNPTFTGTVSLAALAASGAITGATVRATGTIMAAGGFQIG